MKHSQRGFVLPIIIIAVLVISGGVYVYTKSLEDTIVPEDSVVASTTPKVTAKDSTEPITTEVKADIQLSDEKIAAAIDVRLKKEDGYFRYSDGKAWNIFIDKIHRGDINQDGYVDAIVETGSCGASCSSGISFVLNDKKGSGIAVKDVKFPNAFLFSSAGKTSFKSITVSSGIITISSDNFCVAAPTDTFCGGPEFRAGSMSFRLEGNVLVEV